MKRESSAERALNTQIKNLNAKLDQITRQRYELQLQYETVRDLRNDMENEMHRLRKARIAASEKAKS